MQALINSEMKINVIYFDFIKKFNLYIQNTDMKTQKINGSKLKIFRIVIVLFLIENKVEGSWFFEKTFLLTNINIDVTLKMSFLKLNNMRINFEN